jgi:hypothetical protein
MRRLIAFFGLLFLCACAMGNPLRALARSSFPFEIDMNKDAGRGEWIFANVRVAGQELPFFLDTGAAVTCIDKSLEPKLGKRFLTMPTRTFIFTNDSGVYAAPDFYLGKTLLTNSETCVMALDCSKCSQLAGRPVMGILGIDVLRNYCLQLDFAANKVRFLDDQHLDKSKLGTPFPLKQFLNGCYYIEANLVSTQGPGSVIDIGDNADGWLVSGMFQQWTNQPATPSPGEAGFPNGILGGKLYTGLALRGLVANDKSMAPLTDYNGLGLQFFARNLVTLDFPNQTLYLKQTSVGPFFDKNFKTTARAEGKSALKFLANLKTDGLLPGWPHSYVDVRRFDFHFIYPDFVTIDFITGGSSVYHYRVSRPSKKAPWQIQRAWLTDEQGKTVSEFPLN